MIIISAPNSALTRNTSSNFLARRKRFYLCRNAVQARYETRSSVDVPGPESEPLLNTQTASAARKTLLHCDNARAASALPFQAIVTLAPITLGGGRSWWAHQYWAPRVKQGRL